MSLFMGHSPLTETPSPTGQGLNNDDEETLGQPPEGSFLSLLLPRGPFCPSQHFPTLKQDGRSFCVFFP